MQLGRSSDGRSEIQHLMLTSMYTSDRLIWSEFQCFSDQINFATQSSDFRKMDQLAWLLPKTFSFYIYRGYIGFALHCHCHCFVTSIALLLDWLRDTSESIPCNMQAGTRISYVVSQDMCSSVWPLSWALQYNHHFTSCNKVSGLSSPNSIQTSCDRFASLDSLCEGSWYQLLQDTTSRQTMQCRDSSDETYLGLSKKGKITSA